MTDEAASGFQGDFCFSSACGLPAVDNLIPKIHKLLKLLPEGLLLYDISRQSRVQLAGPLISEVISASKFVCGLLGSPTFLSGKSFGERSLRGDFARHISHNNCLVVMLLLEKLSSGFK